MTYLSFWLVVLAIPLIVVVGNGTLRWVFGSPQSASADLVLAFVVFDAAVAIQAHDFEPLVKAEAMRTQLTGIYVSLLIANLLLWFFAAFRLELNLLSKYNFRQRKYSDPPWHFIFLSYAISLFVFATNVIIFAYGG